MKNETFIISSNECIAKDVYCMKLVGDTSDIRRPGQFVNLTLDGFFLRRPISICDHEDNMLTLIYKVVGQGTKFMSEFSRGKEVDILIALGNGFDTDAAPDTCTVIGGGVGVPPMYGVAKDLIAKGKKVHAILGFNTKDDVFYVDEFRALGCEVTVTTVDGSVGKKGFVTDAMEGGEYVLCCGPKPMLVAVYNKCGDGQFSFEERMGCGFGACVGCTIQTKAGAKRVCKDGPIFVKEVIQW